jgi:hypothetical protein
MTDRRRPTSPEGKILAEIADLLIEIRDRLPAPTQEPSAPGPVLLQEPEAPPVKRKPGRPRKIREAS